MSEATADDQAPFIKRAWGKILEQLPGSFWFYAVAVVPFMFIVWFRGWDATFQTGEAYLYLIGLTIAVIGEIVIELSENGIEALKRLTQDERSAAIISSAAALAAAAWGFVLVVTQPRINHPTTSLLQVVIFFISLSTLTSVRFAFKGKGLKLGKLKRSNTHNMKESVSSPMATAPNPVPGQLDQADEPPPASPEEQSGPS